MASSSVVSELVWHFAGYLRTLPHDEFTVKIMYDGGAQEGVGPDGADPVEHPVHLPDTPFVGSQLNVPTVPVFPAPELIHAKPSHASDAPFHIPHQPFIEPHPLPPLQGPVAGGGGGGGGGGGVGDFQITVSYGSGGDQELIDIHQFNALVSSNQVYNNFLVSDHLVNAPVGVADLNNQNATQLIEHMQQQANDAIPTSLNVGDDLKSFIDARDAHPLATEAHDAPFDAQLGQYVNGVAVTDGSDPHQVTSDLYNTVSNQASAGLPAPPTGDHHADSIQTVSVGSNIQANDAVLTSLGGLSTSLAVLGNYYQTQSIVQTNVFVGHDDFSGGVGTTSIAANTIQNIADTQNDVPTLTFTSDGSGTTPSGLHWSVDVCNGDFLNVHSLVQTNFLQNNNVVCQTSYVGDSQIIAGGNTQTNFAEFQNLTANYQLIVVEGSYHQADLIYQTNLLLDNNLVDFNGQGLASQSGTGGGNNLVNDASITDTANHNYQQFNSDAMTVIQALESQSGTLNPDALSNAFPNLFGNINVLVVTGNYYDINYISQTNVMSNSNVVQLNGSATAPAGATQSVSSGHDITVNAATIVDGGSALSPYLQGNYYNDMILIQTNIIGNDAKIGGQDPNQLAPELVAFTGALEGASPHADVTVVAAPNPQQHHDGVAAVLH